MLASATSSSVSVATATEDHHLYSDKTLDAATAPPSSSGFVDAAALLSKGDSTESLVHLPESVQNALRQRAAEQSADALMKASKNVSGAVTPAHRGAMSVRPFAQSDDPLREDDRVAAVCALTENTIKAIRGESERRQEAEQRAKKAEEAVKKAEEERSAALAEATRAKNSRTWRILWFAFLVSLGLCALLYTIGLAASAWAREPQALSMDIRFVSPHDGARIARPKSEVELGTLATSESEEPERRGWRSALLWPVEWWNRDKLAEEKDRRAVVVHPLVDSLNSGECIAVTPDEIHSGKLLGGRVSLIEIRTSLLYHLASKRITAVCAQHIGVLACYCVLDMRFPDGAKQNTTLAGSRTFMDLFRPGDYLEIFNPTIVGLSRNRALQVQEKNVFCQKSYFAKRFETIAVEFLDSNGDLWERNFRGVHSFNLQHAAEIQRGISGCRDSAADELIQLMRSRAGGSQERSAFERAMLFTDTDAYRDSRPAPPKPRTPVALPKIVSSPRIAGSESDNGAAPPDE